MNFELDDEQRTIQATARDLLERRLPTDRLRALLADGHNDRALWEELVDLGWAGLAIGEEHGGQGLGIVELAVITEELGRALAPVPLLANAAAAIVVEHAGSERQRSELLPALADGRRRGAVAVAREGVARLAIDAGGSTALVVVEGERAALAPPATVVTPEATIDPTRRYATVYVDGGEPLPGPTRGALDRIEVLLAAELCGVAQRALELAVAYARQRHQFGRPIGAFQGVSHRCARMLLDVDTARALTLYAAWAADHDDGALPLAASAAKAAAAEAAWHVTASSLQVHGGIGFAWEHDIHLLLKRARATGQVLGTAREHRTRIAALRRSMLAGAPTAASA